MKVRAKKKIGILWVVAGLCLSNAAFGCLSPTAAHYDIHRCLNDGYTLVGRKFNQTFWGSDSRSGLLDPQGKLLLPLEYGDVMGPYQNRVWVKEKTDNGWKYFLIDLQKNKITRQPFEDVGAFNNGYAHVRILNSDDNTRSGFIDINGKFVIEAKYYEGIDPSEGLFGVKEKGKYYYLDKDGNIVISNPDFEEITPFNEGLAAVKVDDKWGYINRNGQFVIPPKFEEVSEFKKYNSNLRAIVSVEGPVKINGKTKQREHFGVIDETGRYIVAPNYRYITMLSNGLIGGRQYNHSQGNIIEIETGNIVLSSDDMIFEAIDNSENLFKFGKRSKLRVLNTNTRQLSDQEYSFIGDLYYDRVLVTQGRLNNKKYGYLDETGKLVIPVQFRPEKSSNPFAHEFRGDYAWIYRNGDWNFLDKNGNIVSEKFYPNLSYFSEGLARVEEGGKSGFIDTTGKVVIPIKYTKASSFSGGKSKVTIDYDGYYPREFEIDKQNKILTARKSLASFQDGLEVGDETKQGMVVEVKGNLVLIQTEGDQCSQRDYNGNCKNWISKSAQEWIKKDSLVPVDY